MTMKKKCKLLIHSPILKQVEARFDLQAVFTNICPEEMLSHICPGVHHSMVLKKKKMEII